MAILLERSEQLATWRDQVSAIAQGDLDGLLDSALNMAEERLAEAGEFFPFGLVVTRDGATEVVAAPPVDAERAQQLGYQAIGAMKAEIRAAVMVTDVRIPETGGDAVEVFLEHIEGVALGVLEPYRIVAGEIIAGQLEAHSEQRRIWP